MESIANEEERIAGEVEEEEEEEEKAAGNHSFWPQPWPDNVSQVPPDRDLKKKLDEANNAEARRREYPAAQRYLPCHYFDYICGSSTGA